MPSITPSQVIASSAQINPDIIVNSDINSAAAIAYSKLNLAGGIVNADVNTSAAIVDTKLAAISTAGKVSGAALTSLASIPAGAGIIPAANVPAGITFTTGTIQMAGADTERTQQNIGGLTEIKRIKISAGASGVVSVVFDLHDEVSGGAQAQIYVNSVAAGTLRSSAGNTSYVTYTEDITVAAGDIVQLYWNNTVANKQAYVRNFRVRAAQTDKTVVITD